MAKRPADRQRTDATRIGRTGRGKLDQRAARAAAKPSSPVSPDRANEVKRRPGAKEIERSRKRLEQERDAAITRLRDLGISPDTDEDRPRAGTDTVLDEGDRAQASERQDMNFVTRERLANRINRLSAALERIDAGTFGVCAVCGEPIERERLAAMPEVETCLACQERREREAGRPQVA